MVVRAPAWQVRQRHFALEALDQIVGSELVAELGVGEVSERLGHQVLELRGQHATDLDAQAGKIADENGDLALAAHGQERALAEDLQLGRKRRHPHETLHPVAQQVAAEAAQSPLDLDVHVAPDVGAVLERVRLDVLALGGDRIERQACARGEDGVGDLGRVAPVVDLFARIARLRVLHGQDPRRDPLLHLVLVGRGRQLHDEDLLLLTGDAADDGGPDGVDPQAVEPGDGDRLRRRVVGGLATARRHHALVDGDRQRRALPRDRQCCRMDVGVQPQLVVADRERRGLPPHAQDAGRLAGEPELDALLQLGGVDRMAEAQPDHRLLQGGIDRVLEELRVGQRQHEERGLKGEPALGEANVSREGSFVERHRVLGADRPVVLRLEPERGVRRPAPGSCQRGAHRDPARHVLADAGERSD